MFACMHATSTSSNVNNILKRNKRERQNVRDQIERERERIACKVYYRLNNE